MYLSINVIRKVRSYSATNSPNYFTYIHQEDYYYSF